MAIDYGRRRIGFAISDPTNRFAMPLCTIDTGAGKSGPSLRKQVQTVLPYLRQLVLDQQIGRIVVGLPLRLDGESGPEVLRVRRFQEMLCETLELEHAKQEKPFAHWPLVWDTVDERFSTTESQDRLNHVGARFGGKRAGPLRMSHKRKHLDSVSAMVILESYLLHQ